MIRRLPAIWVCCWCAVACAQPAAETAPKAQQPAVQATAAEPAEASSGNLFVRDADGRWVAVPDATDPADVADADPHALAPPAYIARLQFDGQVDGDHADLTATVRVEITRSNDWFELPLALDQALVYDSDYEGVGTHAPAVARNGESGIRWQFQGVGTHRLTIRFRLPLKTTTAGRQLQLTLPALPANYIAHARLRIPDARVVPADPSPNVVLRRRVLDSGDTEIECDISGTRWDLTWRTPAADEPPLAQVRSGIRIRRDAGFLRLTAIQECIVEQGTIAEVLARLPSDFQLESVKLAGDAPHELAVEPAADRPGWVRVPLGADLQGVFDLEWRLTRPFPSGGGNVVVDGLELADARLQGGTIEIEAVDGFAARHLESSSQGVQRIDVGDPRAGEPVYVLRFQFQRRPGRLEYALQPVEAVTDAESDAVLLIDAARNDLHLDVRLEVISGQVQEIVIDWPNHSAAGWVPGFAHADVAVSTRAAASDIVNGTLDLDALSADPDRLRLQLSRGCSGSLRTMLRFTRAAAPSGSLELSLPRPVATRSRAQALTVVNAFNVESTVTSDGRQPAPVPRNGPLPSGLPPQFASQAAQTYELSAEPRPVQVQWSEQQQSITADTALSVEMLNDTALLVSQEIAYQVKYGYVKSLLLEMPQPSRPAAAGAAPLSARAYSFQLDGAELPSEFRDNLWRVALPADRIGRFQLTIQHVVPADAAAHVFAVPILQAADAPFGTTGISMVGARSLRLAPAETGWQLWHTRSGDAAWLSATPRSHVQLEVDDDVRRVPQQFIVDSAFVRTWFGDPGQADLYAEYALRDAPHSLFVTLPAAAVSPEFRWNGVPLAAPDDVHSLEGAPGRFIVDLRIADGETADGRLTVRYRTPVPANPALVSAYAAEFPRFGDKVLVNTTLWEVILPPGMQLSAPPSGMVPQYTWEREHLFWTRRSTPEYLELRKQAAANESIAAPALPRGNAYAYSAIGVVPRGAVGGMAQSLIVLIGAGFSLLVGFIVRRIPATRNLLSVLVLGFLATLAGLWRLELMQLLLQPAVFGLLLAAVAATFDIARHDRRRGQRDSTIERSPSSSGRRAAAVPRLPAIPARTAVFHPESASESGRPS